MIQMDCSTSAAAPASVSALRPPPSCIGRIAWPGEPAKKQIFSLPENIIYYMARNPRSPVVYLKLATSCKYFFEMLPLLVVKWIYVDKDGKRMCANDLEECKKKKKKCCVKLDLGKLTKSKIWLLTYLQISYNENFASTLPKLYRCENATIELCCKEMNMDEFKLWGTTFTELGIYKGKITEANGSIATIDSMLETIPGVKNFAYWFDDGTPAAVTALTMKNLLKLQTLENLHFFQLMDIPDILSVKDLFAFIKTYKDTHFYLNFHHSISADYKIQLDGLINDIIALKVSNRLIEYRGQDKEKLKIMEDRFFY